MTLLTTPLDALHRELGARMVPFAGYDMPVQYPTGIIREHLHTRTAAGLFDVSHMGQVLVDGAGAAAGLESLVPVDLAGLGIHRQTYALFTNEQGGVLDDLIITRWAPETFFLVVNAGCKQQDIDHLRAHLGGLQLTVLAEQALLALQGPAARQVMRGLCPAAAELVFMQGCHATIAGVDVYITCSGYTGEDGFEISVPALSRWLDRDQVVPGQVGPGVRPGPGEHHGVASLDEGQVRVVPAAAQVVAGLVVRGEHHPARGREARLVELPGAVEEDRDLLPVGLVLVDPAEGRSPVVEGVEEPVLADQPVTVADDPAVVGGAIGLEVLLLQQEGLGRTPAGHTSSEDQREPVERVDESAEQPHSRQAARPCQPRRTVLVRDAHLVGLLAGHDARQGGGLAGDRLVDLAQHRRVEGLGRSLDHGVPVGQLRPEGRVLGVLVHGDRIEVLALGEPHHGLIGPQQREIIGPGIGASRRHGPHSRAGAPGRPTRPRPSRSGVGDPSRAACLPVTPAIWPHSRAGLPLGYRRPLVAPSRSGRN